MGYTTEFEGGVELDKQLDDETYALLCGLSRTRRMARKGLEPKYGVEGEFYYNPDSEDFGQEHDDNIIDYNRPPRTQPSLWCQWTPTEDRQWLKWDGGEKFYAYVEWMKYLIDRILKPRGYTVNGCIEWQGEESDDRGRIIVKNNKVRTQHAEILRRDDE